MMGDDPSVRRRSVLLAGAAAASTLAGCGNAAPRQVGGDAAADSDLEAGTRNAGRDGDSAATGEETLIRLDAHEAGWRGLEPEAISGEVNPTLHLTEGVTYEFVWRNGDDKRHQLKIADDGGREVARTEPAEDEGTTRSTDVTVTDDLAEYFCEFHEDDMRGEIRVVREESGVNESIEDGADEDESVGNVTDENESVGNVTIGNVSVGNASVGNVTVGNMTIGNES